MLVSKLNIDGLLTPLYPLHRFNAKNNGIELNILGTNPGADHLRPGIAKYFIKMPPCKGGLRFSASSEKKTKI
jgi:hypothetical protein